MDNENSTELSPGINEGEIQEYMKNNYSIEFSVNDLLPAELENQGYRKMSIEEIHYVEPLLQLAPQLMVDRINKAAVEQAFKAATQNSYKCLLDPSLHLATVKGTTDVFLGSGLDNVTNKVKGQARWIKNDVVLSISNAPQVALNAFNALSIMTGQYFMAQINANLLDIKDGIDGIKQYIDAVKQSVLEVALQDLHEIIGHLQFIKNGQERVHATIIQIDDIRTVAKRDINLNKKQIDKIMREASKSDKEPVITSNIRELRNYLVQYRYAVYVYNLAQIIKIYLNDITDVEELGLFRDELFNIINQYKETFNEATVWAKKYIDEAKVLNKESKGQIFFALATGIGTAIYAGVPGSKSANYLIAGKTASLVNDLFNDKRKKKKEAHILSNDEYQIEMNDMKLIDSSIAAMDRYIEMTGIKVEIIAVESECYIKYIEAE